MARNEEKAQSMLNRWLAGKQADLKPERQKRPYLASECHDLNEADKWRQQILREIGKKVMEIQNAGLGEHRCGRGKGAPAVCGSWLRRQAAGMCSAGIVQSASRRHFVPSEHSLLPCLAEQCRPMCRFIHLLVGFVTSTMKSTRSGGLLLFLHLLLVVWHVGDPGWWATALDSHGHAATQARCDPDLPPLPPSAAAHTREGALGAAHR